MNEKEALLQKSERAFAAAELLLQADSLEAAASRTYYAWFYVAEALLLSQGLRFSSHGQVIAQYGLRFAKDNVLDRRFHRTLDEAYGLRQYADYATAPDLDRGKIFTMLQEGEAFLSVAKDYLKRKGTEGSAWQE